MRAGRLEMRTIPPVRTTDSPASAPIAILRHATLAVVCRVHFVRDLVSLDALFRSERSYREVLRVWTLLFLS